MKMSEVDYQQFGVQPVIIQSFRNIVRTKHFLNACPQQALTIVFGIKKAMLYFTPYS
jgi:hypothetical protein